MFALTALVFKIFLRDLRWSGTWWKSLKWNKSECLTSQTCITMLKFFFRVVTCPGLKQSQKEQKPNKMHISWELVSSEFKIMACCLIVDGSRSKCSDSRDFGWRFSANGQNSPKILFSWPGVRSGKQALSIQSSPKDVPYVALASNLVTPRSKMVLSQDFTYDFTD